MKTKKIAKMIVLTMITVTMASANKPTNFSPNENRGFAYVKTIYSSMSTAELQQKIERCSEKGEISFTMGMELMKRWSNS